MSDEGSPLDDKVCIHDHRAQARPLHVPHHGELDPHGTRGQALALPTASGASWTAPDGGPRA
jgi:hypothetical protein